VNRLIMLTLDPPVYYDSVLKKCEKKGKKGVTDVLQTNSKPNGPPHLCDQQKNGSVQEGRRRPIRNLRSCSRIPADKGRGLKEGVRRPPPA